MKTLHPHVRSVIGKIPREWKIWKVKDLFDVETGTTPSTKHKEYWENGTVNWITPTDLSKLNGRIEIIGSDRKTTQKALREKNITLMPKGSIVISTRAPVGYVALLKESATFNQGCKGLIIRETEKIYPNFYCYYLLSKNQALQNLSSGSTFKELSKDRLEDLLLPLPPMGEQRKIAEILSTMDGAIGKVNEAIGKTQRLKKGLMQRLLTEGIGHTEFKETEIGRIPKEWDVVKIDDISEVKRGASPRPIGEPSYFSENGRGWVRISDVTSTYKYLKKTSQYLSKKGEERSVKVNPGDLIMSICATIGKPIIVDMEACIHDGFVWFCELSKTVDVEYLFYVLQRNEETFSSKRQTGTQGNLNTTLVGRTQIPLPPMGDQKKIAEVLGAVDDRLEVLRKRKEKLERLKRGLMEDLLTGKKRVKMS